MVNIWQTHKVFAIGCVHPFNIKIFWSLFHIDFILIAKLQCFEQVWNQSSIISDKFQCTGIWYIAQGIVNIYSLCFKVQNSKKVMRWWLAYFWLKSKWKEVFFYMLMRIHMKVQRLLRSSPFSIVGFISNQVNSLSSLIFTSSSNSTASSITYFL